MTAPSPGERDVTWSRLRALVALALCSPLLRPRRFALVFAATLAAVGAALAISPRSYEVRCELFVQRHAALSPPSGVLDHAAARSAALLVVSEASRRDLARRAGLVATFDAHRPALLRVLDRVLEPGAAADPQAKLDRMTRLLERKLRVDFSRDGTVAIVARWQDPSTAYAVASAAQEQFLETWHAIEVASLAELARLLDARAAEMRAEAERRVAQLPATSVDLDRERDGDLEPAASEDLVEPARAGARLDARRGPADREEEELDVDSRLRFESMGYGPPLESGPARREDELARRLTAQGRSALATAGPLAGLLLAELVGPEGSPRRSTARAQARLEARRWSDVADRAAATHLAYESSQAAFDDRYLVVEPPEVPREPLSPAVPEILLAAVLDGLLLALVATTRAELLARAMPPATEVRT
jgi:hypothetical protein